ncbi:MAG TPA: hypothetical protein PKN32_14800 [Bacteroidales bacterium]|jgi:hypothetical protein|nr:hypothetical protein [Bacteroidales bacterium]
MYFLTEIESIDPLTGESILKAGPNIRARSFAEAKKILKLMGIPDCRILGRLIEEIPFESINQISPN